MRFAQHPSPLGGAGGGDSFEEGQFLQHPASALRHRTERIIGDVHRQAGLLGDLTVDATDQRTPTRHDNPAVDQIGREFGRTAFEGESDVLQNAR